MILRPYDPRHATAFARLYRNSVRCLGGQACRPPQVEASARSPEDLEEFRQRLAHGVTLIAAADGAPPSVGPLDPPDDAALLNCASPVARRGFASGIYGSLESEARHAGCNTLRTKASRVTRPLFGQKGSVIVETEYPVRHQVSFERFKMEKMPTRY